MAKLFGLCAVAGADVVRSVWVLDCVLAAERAGQVELWTAAGLLLATGGLSIALLGLAMRACLGHGPSSGTAAPSS